MQAVGDLPFSLRHAFRGGGQRGYPARLQMGKGGAVATGLAATVRENPATFLEAAVSLTVAAETLWAYGQGKKEAQDDGTSGRHGGDEGRER